jgi:hypothetical protein
MAMTFSARPAAYVASAFILGALTGSALGLPVGWAAFHGAMCALLFGVLRRLIRAGVGGTPIRAKGKTPRNAAARHAYARHAGYPKGRPGYVIDYVVPLASGGADAPSNMQWKTIAEATAKDRVERAGCRSGRPDGER